MGLPGDRARKPRTDQSARSSGPQAAPEAWAAAPAPQETSEHAGVPRPPRWDRTSLPRLLPLPFCALPATLSSYGLSQVLVGPSLRAYSRPAPEPRWAWPRSLPSGSLPSRGNVATSLPASLKADVAGHSRGGRE